MGHRNGTEKHAGQPLMSRESLHFPRKDGASLVLNRWSGRILHILNHPFPFGFLGKLNDSVLFSISFNIDFHPPQPAASPSLWAGDALVPVQQAQQAPGAELPRGALALHLDARTRADERARGQIFTVRIDVRLLPVSRTRGGGGGGGREGPGMARCRFFFSSMSFRSSDERTWLSRGRSLELSVTWESTPLAGYNFAIYLPKWARCRNPVSRNPATKRGLL